MNKALLKKIENVKEDDPFLITITVFNKKKKSGNNIDTFLFINNFPYADFDGTKKKIVELIDKAKKK